MAIERRKRISPVPTAVCPEELERIDDLCRSRPFKITRSQILCLSYRFTEANLRHGLITLESLFDEFLNEPVAPLSGVELARAARIALLLEQYMAAAKLSRGEAVMAALEEGLETLAACGFAVDDEEVLEQRRA